MNNDQVKGRIDQAVGKIKEETGDLLDDKQLEEKGRAEKIGGKVQAEYGNVKENVKDGIDKL
ncbi:MAG: CsbD family protein [Burkholderiaceae bacterium]